MSPTSTKRRRPPWRGHKIVMAIMVATALMLSAAASFAQGIATDKLSYVPGERVMITGQGWLTDQVVTLSIGNAAGTRAPYEIEVIPGSDGGFTDSSFVVQEIDRGQMLTVAAEGLTSGVQTVMAVRDGAAPGSLRCSTLGRFDSTHYSLVTGQQVACTIEGATDLSAAQQAGSEPVEVLVRTTRFGNMPATVTSVRGTTISFVYTAPPNGCDPATVSYGPITVCDSSYGQCTVFPAQGNDVNSYYLSGTRLAAGFIFTNGWRDICCAAPKLKIEKYPQFGTFTQGGQATYTLVVSNPVAVGGTWANNVKVSDQLPGNGGMVWQYATASQGSCSIVNNLLNCSLGTIQPQRSVTITVATTQSTPPAACQAQPNPRAIATADGGFIAYASGFLTCTPPPTQLKVVKTPDNGPFTMGSQVSFTIVVSNPGAAGSASARNVQLNDALPGNGGLIWASATSTAGSCSVVNNNLSCSLGDIPAGGSVTVRVFSTQTTPDTACQYQPNAAAIATAEGGITAEDQGSLICTPSQPPQLRVVKTPDNGTFAQGSQLSYTIVVSNPAAAGAAPATNVILNDLLPGNGGLVWATATPTQGACSLTSNSLNCALGTIQAGGSVTVTVLSTQTTPMEACQPQPNPVALATADGGLSAQDSGYQSCTPPGVPQLQVAKTPDNGTFNQGGQVRYTIVVRNPGAAGSAPATNVRLTDVLPINGGLTWTSYTATQGSCTITGNTLSCGLGNIAAGGSVRVVVSSPVTTPASACQPQPNPVAIATADGGLTAQDSGSQSCAPPQLRVVKTPDNGTFTQGGPVSYTIVVSNPAAAGGSPAVNVRLTDLLPVNGGLTWTSYTATQGTCTITGNTLSCTLGNIAAGSAATIVVSSPATTPAAACQSQPNPAAIATANGGLTAQDSGSQSCTPPAPPQLEVVKTPDNGTFTQGGQVRYTIVVRNPAAAGGTPATNVRLTDILPINGGLTWTSYTATQGGCSITGNTLSCFLGTIPAAGSVTVVVSSPVTTPDAACQPQPNPAAIATADGGLTAQDSGSQSCTPSVPPQLRVVKTPDNGTFAEGGQVTYTIVVSNPAPVGAGSALDVQLTDILPTNGGLTWTSYTSSQGSCTITGNTLNCSLGSIVPGGSVLVTVSSPATTPLAACQSQPNPAAIATASGGLTAQDSGSQSCVPTVPPQLRVVKTPDNGTFTAGGQATFNIVVRNPSAGAAATNVQLNDVLPTNGGLTWTSYTATQGTCTIVNNTLSCGLGTIPAGGSVTVTVSSPTTTPISACQSQPNPAAIATAAGGLTAQDSGSLTCGAPCIIPGVTISNTSWNRFNIPPGTSPVVWVHAHTGRISGIPTNTRTTVLFDNVSITVNGVVYPMPDGLMIFDPTAPATPTTTYNAALNRWETLINPNYMSDEMFFTGAAIPVTPALAAGGKATLSYTVVSQAPSISFPWQWSAAVYTYWPADWNQAMIQPFHRSYHAGTPLNIQVQRSLIAGPRGGGGSNFTGSWSATGNGVCP